MKASLTTWRATCATSRCVSLTHAQIHSCSKVIRPSEFFGFMLIPDGVLLVLATHGRGGIGRVVFGSVADEIVRTARSSVIAVPVAEQGQPLNVASLARGTIVVALSMARRYRKLRYVAVARSVSHWRRHGAAFGPGY